MPSIPDNSEFSRQVRSLIFDTFYVLDEASDWVDKPSQTELDRETIIQHLRGTGEAMGIEAQEGPLSGDSDLRFCAEHLAVGLRNLASLLENERYEP